ncbi:MAG: lytic murein transglycosylase [Rickettsiales bacterium]|jgi:membrane-bound lytic murein transglycosylase B|nr:lytic murein transglycosylase [Rickettsiales bacterium]
MRFKKHANKNRGLVFGGLAFLAACLISVAPLVDAYSADEAGEFDIDRWYTILHRVQGAAIERKIGAKTINAAIQESGFIPEIVQRDKNQAEFTRTLKQYLDNSVGEPRIGNGKKAANSYRTLLARAERTYGVPKNVMLAFWGMESDYGAFKSQYKVSDAFLTLIYDGRRGEFFEQQLLALMKIADKNKLNIANVRGSWAGAIGHFQFIPTTLAQYGRDGNGDGKIDVVNSVADAMASAGNYLKKMGWDKNGRIVRQVRLPANFNMGLCDGHTKKTLGKWRALGVAGVPQANKTAGLICDVSIYPRAYLAYDNFYRVKKWNNSNHYAVAVALIADALK